MTHDTDSSFSIITIKRAHCQGMDFLEQGTVLKTYLKVISADDSDTVTIIKTFRDQKKWACFLNV